MRDVTVTARDFKRFVWPAIGYQPVENGGEWDDHVSLLSKVKSVSREDPEDERELPGRLLEADEHTFRLEEGEYGRLKKVLKSWRQSIAGGVADEMDRLQTKVEAAERFDATADADPAAEDAD